MLWRAIDQSEVWGGNIMANRHASIALGCDNTDCPDRADCWAHELMHGRFKRFCPKCAQGEIHEHLERKIRCNPGDRVPFSWIGDIASKARSDNTLEIVLHKAQTDIVDKGGRALIQTRNPARVLASLCNHPMLDWPGFEIGTTFSNPTDENIARLHAFGSTGPLELTRFLSLEPVERLVKVWNAQWPELVAAIAASRARWVYIGFRKGYKPSSRERQIARSIGGRLDEICIKVINKRDIGLEAHEESKYVSLP